MVTRVRNPARLLAVALGVLLGGLVLAFLVPLCANETQNAEQFMKKRAEMVRRDIASRGVTNRAVLAVMGRVPREEYVLPTYRSVAYDDSALPIEARQTISQPYIVAAMTEALGVGTNSVVLEVGTGSGYQAAVLAELVKEVYTIEIVEELAESAEARLARLGYTNVTVRAGDGYLGWPEHAPFDGIIVTAAPDHIPQPLIDQLKPGARMVIPVGEQHDVQHLLLLTKQEDGTVTRQNLMPVRFVPLTGKHGEN